MTKAETKDMEQGSGIFRWIVLLISIPLLAGGVFLGIEKLQDPQFMPVKVVRIDGQLQRLKREDLERAVAAELHGGFFSIDVAAMRSAALELPWVDRVDVRLVWPETLQMNVTEQQPLARWQEDRLLNLRGELFQPVASEIPEGLPVLSGPDGSEIEVVGRYRELKAELAVLGLVVTKVVLDARRAWTVITDSGLVIKLGSKDSVARLARFIRIYPALQAEQREMMQVDLRYPNGFAVQHKVGRGDEATAVANEGQDHA
jgi:cell division protein FtsQ